MSSQLTWMRRTNVTKQEVDDRQQHEGEGDEAVADFSRLRYKRERHDGAREGGDEDGRPAQCLCVGEPAMREQAQCSVIGIWSVCGPTLSPSEPGGGACVGGTRLPGVRLVHLRPSRLRQGHGLLSEQCQVAFAFTSGNRASDERCRETTRPARRTL